MRLGRSGPLPWLLALSACDDGSYDLVLHVPGDPSRAAVIEVAVLGSCSEIVDAGQEPDEPIRTVALSAAESEPIGWLAEGSYGLYGRAWDSDCFLYAGGCSPVRIEDGGSGTLDVFLAALPLHGCDHDETCSGGRCIPLDVAVDGGPEPDAGAGPDAGPDGGCDGPAARIVGSIDTPGSATDVAVDGTTAFVADDEEGLRIVDVSDPQSPVELGSIDTEDRAYAVAMAGEHAYVADVGDGLVVIDVADPAAPAIVGSLDTKGFAWDVAVRDGYAYVADSNWDLDVIDVSDPTAPTLVARADVEGSISSVAVSDTHVFVGSSFRLQVVSIASPEAPVLVSYANGRSLDIALWADRAFSAAGGYGMNVFDVSDPGRPTLTVALEMPGDGHAVAAAEGIVLVADDVAGLVLVDATNPDAPAITGTVDTPGLASAVAIDGSLAFVADGTRGLHVIDLGCFGFE